VQHVDVWDIVLTVPDSVFSQAVQHDLPWDDAVARQGRQVQHAEPRSSQRQLFSNGTQEIQEDSSYQKDGHDDAELRGGPWDFLFGGKDQ
jgi:hypothetical protein